MLKIKNPSFFLQRFSGFELFTAFNCSFPGRQGATKKGRRHLDRSKKTVYNLSVEKYKGE